jgi:hypothetical protein
LGQSATGGCPKNNYFHVIESASDSDYVAVTATVIVFAGAIHVDFHAAFDFAGLRFAPGHRFPPLSAPNG